MWDGAIRQTYQADDKDSCKSLDKNCLKLRSQIENFLALLATNGWKRTRSLVLDTVDIRMGGLLPRIKRAESRIRLT